MYRALSFPFFAVAVVGCAGKAAELARTPGDQTSAAPGDQLTGPVLEHLNASPYVYLRIKTPKGEVWAAVPQTQIENGTEVTVFNPMRMTKFESTSLKRTFEEVYFGTLDTPDGAMTSPGDNPHATIRSPTPVDIGKVPKATGADARTVAEVWAEKASLAGKTVTIRAVVVKYNAGVMGKNWIHLQDGSGDPKQGTNDITVTSQNEAAIGETITVTGTVRTNKDFGAGYTYPIIVEDATVVRSGEIAGARDRST